MNLLNNKKTIYYKYKSKFGDILIGYLDNYLVYLSFIYKINPSILNSINILNNKEKFKETIDYLDSYFNKETTNFIPKNKLFCSSFTKKVLNLLLNIEKGKTCSYLDLKRMYDEKENSNIFIRAISKSLSSNPIEIIYPCHRIIKSNHDISGYKSGIKIKKELLKLEGNLIIKNKVNNKEISSGALIFKVDNNDLLFLIEKMNLGHFSFPKGHIENNETLEETALREIKEETNLDVNLIKGFKEKISYYPYKYIYKDVYFYLAKLTNFNQEINDFHDNEVIYSKFVSYIEAVNLLTYESDKNILKKAYKFIKLNKLDKS